MISGAAAYGMEKNGVSAGKSVSIAEALASDDWDVVTLQQQSSSSANYLTFRPYLDDLAAYVRANAAGAKIALHQTWAYAAESEKLFTTPYLTPAAMFADIRDSYARAAKDVSADLVIPAGETMRILAESGFVVHRDGFHAHKGIGRYLLALNVYATLSGRDISENSFSDFDEEVTPEAAAAARAIVSEISAKYREINKEYAKEAY
jgi:hypothetical protein